MKFESWVVNESKPDANLGLLRSLKYDALVKQNRYEYFESFVRNFPGKAGVALRVIILRRFFQSFGKNVVLWPGIRFRFPYKIELGDNVSISYDCILQAGGGIVLGDNTLIGPSVKIWSVNHMFKELDRPINRQGYEGRPVIIGNDCWIGSNSFMKPGTYLPNGCVVLPGTVLGKMIIPEYSVISGNPAKIIGPRNRVGAMLGWKKTKEESE